MYVGSRLIRKCGKGVPYLVWWCMDPTISFAIWQREQRRLFQSSHPQRETTVQRFQNWKVVLFRPAYTDIYQIKIWLQLTQGLRQGCMPSPFIFGMLISAAIHVSLLVRLSDDKDTVSKMSGSPRGVLGERKRGPCAIVRLWDMFRTLSTQALSRRERKYCMCYYCRRMPSLNVAASEAASLTLSETKTGAILP